MIDSGAETNMIRESVARQIGIPISSSSQLALQADGHSSLEVVGETRVTLTRDKHSLLLEALVVSNLDSDILPGVPFMVLNDIFVRPSKKQVQIGDDTFVSYSTQPKTSSTHTIHSCTAHILRAPVKTTIWPGEFIKVDTPSKLPIDAKLLSSLDVRVAIHLHGLNLPFFQVSMGRFASQTIFLVLLS